jgi:HAD superfamily hydrolase (TIGR01509 family)
MSNIAVIWDLNDVLFKDFKLDPNTLGIVLKLNSLGINQYICTNTRPSTVKRYTQSISKHFKKIYACKQWGLVKPNPEVFKRLKEELKEERLYFIDNSLKNIKASNDEGFVGIQYIDEVKLLDSLKNHGIINGV